MIELATTSALPLTQIADGTIRIAGTRVSLDSIIYHFKLGASPETIADRFPTVKLSSIYAAIYYYLEHPAAVEEYLRQQEADAAELRRTIEADQDRAGIRERLLRRAAERQLLAT